ncbi:filamentous hemagglutinin N-terminal domain-containing protein [Pseudomonas sp. ABC1]|uniref:two-partner secretion domain-containing protein n=1 Tax=Pseudomonas sp. ABC1 TaxID=2748080 RepID=UPI0015C3C289|nr:GLUG motif-containing protein [Pseudomonas sp. ABC1]QLF93181.1 filamentous hemagglutinin N-terminal domain-containing protein [Pseudomonas sp. ABC1]
MNRIYALVWNPCLGAWSIADEHARRRGKGSGAVVAAAALLLSVPALAADLPTGGTVVSGSGQIGTPNANQMVIDQGSNKLAIDWQSFDIGTGNKVTFNQPGSDSIALNRVLGADGSKIMGTLEANGQVFLVNPNGVLFGQGASVNVGGLVASTLDIANDDFEAGNHQFKGNGGNANVTNNGSIRAADGGSIALLGGTVSNNGVIVANQGTVALAAGNAVTLDFAGDGLLNVQVDEAVVDALVENHQLIKADGGQVLLTANAGDALLKTVINNTGVIEAQTLGEKDGKIVLLGSFDGGTVQVAGTLDASAPNGGDGGFIETSGAHVKVADSAKVTTKAADGKTGTWLIDPTDFTVSAGSTAQTASGIGASTLSSNLANTDVTLQTVATGSEAGDIHVNAAVTWNAGTTLTLSAHNNITINAAITAEHASGKVALEYGQASTDGGTADYSINAPINLQSGNNFSTRKGSTGSVISYTVVNDAAALQDMNNNLAGNYAVGSNIDLASITNWQPVGNYTNNFTGRLDGLGHTLSNLTINRGSENYVGLFGVTAIGSTIRNIGLVGGSVTGNIYVGGLAGVGQGTISNTYATGSVTGNSYVGGLVGGSISIISNAYATGSVNGSGNNVGGLVAWNLGTISNAYATGSVNGSGNNVGGLAGFSSGDITDAYATGNVEGTQNVGGLLGHNDGSSITSAYASGNVTGSAIGKSVGGLVGWHGQGDITDAYATGSVAGQASVGGLVGGSTSSISNAYATGSVTGNSYVGGLVGDNYSIRSSINNAYAVGSVTGDSYVGGLVGYNDGGIGNTYAVGSVTGTNNVGGLVGFNDLGSISASFYATTDAAGNAINNGGVNAGVFTGNDDGSDKTWDELSDPSTYAGWDTTLWTLPGVDASNPGYAIVLPYLAAVTRDVDIVRRAIIRPAGNSLSNTPSYLGVQASNGQTGSTGARQQPDLTQDMLITNPLDDRLNLQVINHGIRLPEGI